MSDSYDPVESSLPGSSVHGDFPGKNTGVGCHSLLQGNLPNPGTEPGSPVLQVDSLPTELRGKPLGKNKSNHLKIIFLELKTSGVFATEARSPSFYTQVLLI